MRRIALCLLIVVVALGITGYWLNRSRRTTPAVRMPITRLHSTSPLERVRAANKLGSMGPAASESVPDLIALLDDESQVWLHEVDPNPGRNRDEQLSPAIAASRALAKIGACSLPYLSTVLQEGSPSSRKHAADAVAQIGGDEAMLILRSALGNKDSAVKAAAAGAMCQMDDRRLAVLQNALRDPNPQVKLAAIKSVPYICGRSEECVAMDSVRGCLQDTDEKVRESAVRAIGYVFSSKGNGQPELDLLKRLPDSSPAVRSEAAFALGSMQSMDAVRPLVRRLTDSSASVRRKAQWALVNITGEDLGSSPDKWAQWIAQREHAEP